jgi:hypothetical protein
MENVEAISWVPLDRSAVQTKIYLTTGVENSCCAAVLHRAGNWQSPGGESNVLLLTHYP